MAYLHWLPSGYCLWIEPREHRAEHINNFRLYAKVAPRIAGLPVCLAKIVRQLLERLARFRHELTYKERGQKPVALEHVRTERDATRLFCAQKNVALAHLLIYMSEANRLDHNAAVVVLGDAPRQHRRGDAKHHEEAR